MMPTQSVQYTAGKRTIGVNLLSQVFFVDRTDGQVFTLPIFSLTSALVIEKIGKVARTDEQIKLCMPHENLS